MRCPKCHYLSFEPEPRCRHCGYDLSLADSALLVDPGPDADGIGDVELRPARSSGIPDSLGVMRGEADSAAPSRAFTLIESPAALAASTPSPSLPSGPPVRIAPVTTTDLPLFVKGLREADPVVHRPQSSAVAVSEVLADRALEVPAAPRPLVVRRPAPDSGVQKRIAPAPAPVPAADPVSETRRLGPLDRDLLEDLERIEAETEGRSRISLLSEAMLARCAAAFLDVALLGVLDAAAIIVVLRQFGLTFGELSWAALTPLIAFVWLMDLGYLLLFTASGQTIGKMIFGLRVVDDSTDHERDGLTVRQVVYRALLTFPSVFMFGAGFLPALLGRGGAIHDRLTHTRVVRV